MGAEVSNEAVVLRRSDSGETDRRLTLLTKDFGKLDVIAKGARKGGSRLAGSSEPIVRATFTWATGRARKFVTQVQPVTSYPLVRANYEKTLAALALCELTAVSVPFESPQHDVSQVFELLVASLQALNDADDWMAAMVWAEALLLEAEGVHPEWTICTVSGQAVAENPAWVSPRAGGLVASDHAEQFHDRFLVSVEALIALKKVVALSLPPHKIVNAQECLKVLFTFWRHVLESRLPANEAMIQGLRA